MPAALPLARALRAFGLAAVLSAIGTPAAAETPATQTPRNIAWQELMPKGWDPLAAFKRNNDLGAISDSDPRAAERLKELREIWDNAPTNPQLDGEAVRLPGYVVPLEEAKGELREFLLVPYFGACIHSPPPPANQIVHVSAARPVKGFRAMDTVWVAGTLKASRSDSVMGTSGYRIDAAEVERYTRGR